MSGKHDLAFTAMDGIFPGGDGVEALWRHVLEARPAPLTHLAPRWRMAPERVLDAEPGKHARAYMDLAFALPERAPDCTLPAALKGVDDARWGRQWAFSHAVLSRLLESVQGPLERGRVALVLATSWSDESAFMADHDITRRGDSSGPLGLDPGEQVRSLCAALSLGGPALAVDTACSSFVYALDTARGLLESGQADAALVVGVNAFLPAPIYLGFSQLRALSRRGELLAFDRDADGIVPGEAVAAVLLEPLSRAQATGRSPLGVLRTLGLSSDGREGGVFAPGRAGQARAYQRAYEHQGALEVDYLEAHGTGTALGDRTELETLSAFYGPRVPAGTKLPLGSVKRVMGHSLAAAGATSLIKALLILRERMVPPHRVATPAAALEGSCFELPGAARPLTGHERPLRVAISSFGFGGGNGHLVVESAPESCAPAQEPSQRPYYRLDLSVVGLDATLAGAPALANLATEPRTMAFPPRFEGESQDARGQFFAGTMDVDVDGFGMGPRPLAAIDPFKMLLSARVRRVISELQLVGDEHTGVVTCGNLGGAHFFTSYRATEDHHVSGAEQAPQIGVDDVPTLLPTMLSGYPAMFNDLKGFHCTLSGGSDLFLAALLTAPHWLRTRVRTLLLSAGSVVSSRTDLLRRTAGGATASEGVCVLALRRADALFGARSFATLRAFVPATTTCDEDEAARLLGFGKPSRCEPWELDAAHVAAGSLQARLGHFAEATGSELLLALLHGEPGQVALSIRAQGRVLGTLLVEVERTALQPAQAPARLPLTLRFSRDLPAPVEPRLAEPSAGDTSAVLAHFETVSSIVLAELELRSRALSLLRRVPIETSPLAELRKSREHVVIEQPRQHGALHEAQLRVPEQHPFYFDHALDHVPGILLLEGMLQLVELSRGAHAQAARSWFVSSLDVNFHRYTEKHAPIALRLEPVEGTPGTLAVVVEQNGELMCSAHFVISQASPSLRLAEVDRARGSIPEARFIHKSRAENVLVSELATPRGLCGLTLPVPSGHALGDGDARQLSMLYFLEMGRQTFMLNAHKAWGVPLGVPMNLLHLRFSLEAPIPRDLPLTLTPSSPPEQWNGLMLTRRFGLELSAGGVALGRGEFRAQAIAAELYDVQRRINPSAA